MGDAMKIVNNMLLGANMASLAEALVLGAKLGLDNKTMYDVISTSSGNSYVVDAKMKKFIMPDKFEPGFAMDVQYKDLTLAQEAARSPTRPGGRLLPYRRTVVRPARPGTKQHLLYVKNRVFLSYHNLHRKSKSSARQILHLFI